MTRVLLAAIAMLALISPAGAQGPTPESAQSSGTKPSGNAERGEELYVRDGCYQCHGREAQGSSATGPRLGPRPIALAAFVRYVRRPSGQMPPYTSKVLSDVDIADIYAFVQARPAPPPVDNIPLLRE